MKYFKIKYMICLLCLLFISCAPRDKDISTINQIYNFVQKQNLDKYNFLFAVHFSKHDCMGCLSPLEHLKNIQHSVNKYGGHTFVCVVGKKDLDFLDVYNAFNTSVPIIKNSDMVDLSFFNNERTPVCYFVNLKTGHLIYMDDLPKDEITFNALKDLILRYSGKKTNEKN